MTDQTAEKDYTCSCEPTANGGCEAARRGTPELCSATERQAEKDNIAEVLVRLDRAHQMGCSDPSDPTRRTTYGDAAKAIRDLLATEAVLRGEIRRSEASLAIFDDLVAQRDALLRGLVKRTKKKNLPAIPIGTRVRVHDSGAAGVGTVVGKDGYGFDGVMVIFDPPAPRGFEDGCCAGVEQCEVLTSPPGQDA